MEFSELKINFAKLLFLDPGNPFACGQKLFPGDVGHACMAAVEWKSDPIVVSEMERLAAETPPESLIATKIETMQRAWRIANDDGVNPKEQVASLRLYAEMAEFMPEKTMTKNINKNEVVNRVMIVKDHGEDENWESKVEEQQRKLVNAN